MLLQNRPDNAEVLATNHCISQSKIKFCKSSFKKALCLSH
jgi:hypothetical protein